MIMDNKKPNPKDYNDLLEFLDDMHQYRARKTQRYGHK